MSQACAGAPSPTRPSFKVPLRACDTHVHVMGPYDIFPLAEQRLYTSPEAPLEDLTAMLEVMGLNRVVVAHPSAFGADIRVTLDAAKRLPARARATIVVDPTTKSDELRSLDRMGVRGIRLAKALGWEATPETLKTVADLAAELDWHIAIWPADLAELYRLQELSNTHGVRIVLDHLAGHCWNSKDGLAQEGFALLLSMLKSGRVWLKLSGMYRITPSRFPWPELVPYGRKLAAECPDRLLWASDWPHVGLFTDNMPKSHELLDWLLEIECDAATREQILVHNPQAVYGFPADSWISDKT